MGTNDLADKMLTFTKRYRDFSFPLTCESKIEIFYEQVHDWQLDIADQCINGVIGPDGEILRKPDGKPIFIIGSGFGVLYISLSYIEMMGRYLLGREERKIPGKRKHECWFDEGLAYIFPQLVHSQLANNLLEKLWKEARNGLYHGAMTGKNIELINPLPLSVPLDVDLAASRLRIDPHELVRALKDNLNHYVQEIKQTGSLRRVKFEERFDIYHPDLVKIKKL